MFKKIVPLILITILAGCGATRAAPYQKDVSPENRDQYSGAEGMAQHQRDQNYLMKKELADKCTAARISLAVAEGEGDIREQQKQNRLIKNTCI